MAPVNAVFIVGCGYVGRRVAERERARGAAVRALAPRQAGVAALTALGIEAVRGDLDDGQSLARVDFHGQRLYYFAPPPARGTRDPRMRAFVAAAERATPRQIVYISTTGVYGDCGGDWVTEDRPVNPGADRACRRLDAEAMLGNLAARTGTPVVILRVPAIYGPGRIPLERLRQGLPLLHSAEAPWSNRIHVDDLVTTCLAAMDRGAAGAVYNVSDGHPTTMTDYVNRVADAIGLPRPRCISRAEAQTALDAGMLSYLAESKRIDNTRLRAELRVALRYPTLEEGLAACLAPAAVAEAAR
jgi:nucleoside-diphosphate-sugar epimerase